MAAKVSFLTKALDDEALKAAPKLIVPADAVVDRGGRKVVFTIDDGHAKAVPVTVKGAVRRGRARAQRRADDGHARHPPPRATRSATACR